jgi:hypothetical protein
VAINITILGKNIFGVTTPLIVKIILINKEKNKTKHDIKNKGINNFSEHPRCFTKRILFLVIRLSLILLLLF